jgi:RsiW-degrading membrane proteinase PrsW (M82 family)
MSTVASRAVKAASGAEALSVSAHPREFLYWALPLALLPLAFTLGRPDDDTLERFDRTLTNASIEVRHQVEVIERDPNSTLDDLLGALPGHRIHGAFLSRNTARHWLFAGLTAAVFLTLIALLFPEGHVRPASLFGIGLFTATAGVVVMLTIEELIAPTYRGLLDGNGDFALSLCGYVVGVGLIEEAAKALPLLWRAQRGPLGWRAACLWGLASGVGFGVAESVVHAERFYNGLATADAYLVRFASCVALHAVWSATVGLNLVTAGSKLVDTEDGAIYGSTILRALAGPALLHGLYDVLLQYQYNAAALGVALISFGWLAWRIEAARAACGLATIQFSNSAASERKNGSASLTIPTV